MAPEYKPKGNCIVGAAGKEDPLFNALINNHVYQHGFQLVTEGCGYTWAIYRWHLPAGYTKFSAGFAMGAGNGCNQITVQILGDSGRPIPISHNGHLGYTLGISSSSLQYITTNIASQHSVAIWSGLSNCDSSGVVDVINDGLS